MDVGEHVRIMQKYYFLTRLECRQKKFYKREKIMVVRTCDASSSGALVRVLECWDTIDLKEVGGGRK